MKLSMKGLLPSVLLASTVVASPIDPGYSSYVKFPSAISAPLAPSVVMVPESIMYRTVTALPSTSTFAPAPTRRPSTTTSPATPTSSSVLRASSTTSLSIKSLLTTVYPTEASSTAPNSTPSAPSIITIQGPIVYKTVTARPSMTTAPTETLTVMIVTSTVYSESIFTVHSKNVFATSTTTKYTKTKYVAPSEIPICGREAFYHYVEDEIPYSRALQSINDLCVDGVNYNDRLFWVGDSEATDVISMVRSYWTVKGSAKSSEGSLTEEECKGHFMRILEHCYGPPPKDHSEVGPWYGVVKVNMIDQPIVLGSYWKHSPHEYIWKFPIELAIYPKSFDLIYPNRQPGTYGANLTTSQEWEEDS